MYTLYTLYALQGARDSAWVMYARIHHVFAVGIAVSQTCCILSPLRSARLEARRLEREQAVCAKLGQMRGSIAAFSVYTMGNGSPAIRMDALDLKSFTCHCCPVGRTLSRYEGS